MYLNISPLIQLMCEINTTLTLLYKETEIKYQCDDSVDIEDVNLLCDILYRNELFKIFNITEIDLAELNKRILDLYEKVKMNPEIEKLIQTNLFMDDPFTTFMTLFSYDFLYIVYPIIVNIFI